jgi:hypothetical protein
MATIEFNIAAFQVGKWGFERAALFNPIDTTK